MSQLSSISNRLLLSGPESGEPVILLHGIGQSNREMNPLARHLAANGFRVWNTYYPSTRHSLADLAADWLAPVVAEVAASASQQGHKWHVATMSMGGILARLFLQNAPQPGLGRCVFLAPPSCGSEVADFLQNLWLYRRFWGKAGQELVTAPSGICHRFQPVSYPLGVVAGNVSIDPWFAHCFEGPNDGKVAVERAKVPGMRDFLVLPYSHYFLNKRRETARQTAHFLQHGCFAHPA